MLKLRISNSDHAPFWAVEKTYSIGRDSTNHLELDDASVSTCHAKLAQIDDNFILKDLGSTNGTYVNNQRITQKSIVCGDRLRFGQVEIEVIDPLAEDGDIGWSLIADSSWLSGQEIALPFNNDKKPLSIGRSAEADITLAGTHLSRQHAEISQIDDTTIAITDLNSANGTYFNSKRIRTCEAHAGDRIRFDVYSFYVFGPGIKLPKAATTQVLNAIKMADTHDKNTPTNSAEKQWKTRPTSPGNRDQIDLYKKSWLPVVFSVAIIAALVGVIGYVGWALLSK